MDKKTFFYRFLKENNAYAPFLKRLKNKRKKGGDFSTFLTTASPAKYIIGAFYWGDEDIWRYLDLKWNDALHDAELKGKF